MKHAAKADVRRAFLRMVYNSTRSLSLARDCKKLFDEKKMPDIDSKLTLR